MGNIDMEIFEEQARDECEKRDLEAQVKAVKSRIKNREDALVEAFEEAGVPKVITKLGTVKISSIIRVSAAKLIDPLTGEEAGSDFQKSNDALRAHGYGSYIHERFNANSVGALIRELERSPEGIPEDLAEALSIHDVISIGFNRAK